MHMNRKLILGIAICAVTSSVKGQVAKWLIPPMYDTIQMADGEDLIITDSLNKKIIWSPAGKRLAMTEDQIFSYKEGFAVATKTGTGVITGFYNKNGKFKPLPRCNVSYSFPYFSNNYLLVQEGNNYRFVNTKGELSADKYVKAYPFANGYASCYTFANFQKRKDPYYLLLTNENERVFFSYGGKEFDHDDIEFISSVNDENIGFVVAKHRLYYFNGKNRSLSPVFAHKGEGNIKNQAKLEDALSLCISNESDSVSVLKAKCGKNSTIWIRFDALLRPLSLSLADGDYYYKKNAKVERSFESPLSVIEDENKYGINWDGKEIIPPQLDNIMSCFDDKAFV